MNREMRRLQEREERRNKKQDSNKSRAQRKASALSQQTGERKPFFVRVRDYLHEVRQELKKVTWPTREQMIAFTTVTVITSTVLTGVVFGLDFVMKQFVLWLVELRS
ncbi:MAG: preprotein translocase subunit SecE [Actinobacteria bacterium]|nr:MAG: preprotein translocase subunit SecE [Actinomycetota bacterium]REK33165.1 MAG: preprotein translocase subunit SecE [Actinomycetota bacterium]